ncbi:hypothetical protein SteCoe_24297 [Stentor coeruleus]|uniref:Uncharacterized protein n=1 Tax=Stentor coeruleus TaxID=5963 RepID=A0A1R2BIB5_9CILI|nr:hypothetical protein SteCoe_24297 [Stentor coeruleus]
MGRKPNKKSSKKPEKSLNSSLEDLFISNSPNDSLYSSRFSPDSLRSLRKELKEAITNIYSKFFSHFCERKEHRTLTQNPFYPVPPDEMHIEKNYCNELTQKVKQLVHLDSLNDIYFAFCKSVNVFMEQISEELHDRHFSDPILQLVCVAEAYFVIENSSNELGKVTQGIFDKKPTFLTCESVTKLAFNSQVLQKFSETLQKLGDCDSLIIQNLLIAEKKLRELEKTAKNAEKGKKQSGNAYITQFSGMTYLGDDLLTDSAEEDFNEVKKKRVRRRRVSKASTAETSGSPFDRISRDDLWKNIDDDNEFEQMDKEIIEFQKNLGKVKPSVSRKKPNLSQEWLVGLKKRIIEHNSFLP